MDITSPATPLPGDIIDISNPKQLPTHDIIVNMDGVKKAMTYRMSKTNLKRATF